MTIVLDESGKEHARLTDDYINRINGRTEKRLLDLSRKTPGKTFNATIYQWSNTKWTVYKSSISASMVKSI
jgi:hypothetical protein